MGGHGGLNILPQKRWNVYNRDNRLKVERDEAKHAAEVAEQQARHVQAERQFRHQLLLGRAKAREGGVALPASRSHDTSDEQPRPDEQLSLPEEAPAQRDERQAHAALAGSRLAGRAKQQQRQQRHQQQEGEGQLQDAPEEQPREGHINFWQEQEARAEHPERQAERRAEQKRRGDPATRTSDAKFDQQFQFGHTLGGPTPWYARGAAPEAATLHEVQRQAAERRRQRQGGLLQGAPQAAAIAAGSDARVRHKRRRSASSGSSSSGSDSGASDLDSGGKRQRHKQRRSSSKHSRHKHKRGSKRSSKGGKGGEAAPATDLVAVAQLHQLRAERVAREAAERARERALLSKVLGDGSGSRYNTGYGYADALRQQQQHLPPTHVMR